METSKNINILISCHKNFETVKNDYVFPIQVGAKLRDYRFNGMLYDDTLDNISDKNLRYCELTAQYWAWKNLDCKFVGFFHYRRYLNLSNKKFFVMPFSNAKLENLDENSESRLGLKESDLENFLKDKDLVLPKRNLCFHNHFQYKVSKGHNIRDLDFCLEVIKKDYPKIYPYAKKYMRAPYAYLCNTFIMRKDLFDEYCEFLFDVLDKHESKYDCKDYSPYAYRVSGFLAERLFGIYATYLIKKRKVRYKRVNRVHVENVKVLQQQ